MLAIKHNMQDQILTDDQKILHCKVCNAEYSGNAGDYWYADDDHIFQCCGQDMELVNKIVTIEYK